MYIIITQVYYIILKTTFCACRNEVEVKDYSITFLVRRRVVSCCCFLDYMKKKKRAKKYFNIQVLIIFLFLYYPILTF